MLDIACMILTVVCRGERYVPMQKRGHGQAQSDMILRFHAWFSQLYVLVKGTRLCRGEFRQALCIAIPRCGGDRICASMSKWREPRVSWHEWWIYAGCASWIEVYCASTCVQIMNAASYCVRTKWWMLFQIPRSMSSWTWFFHAFMCQLMYLLPTSCLPV